jgi:phosphate transport system permease protein
MAAQAPAVHRSMVATNHRRRHLTDRFMTLLLGLVLLGALAVLAWVLLYVAVQGIHAINWTFLTDTPPGNASLTGGGFANGIIGTFIIVGIASLIAIPIGVGAAVYLIELGRGRFAGIVRFVNDVMLGIPTIVTGAFIYAIWVVRFGFSGYAGAFALALVMLPLIIRASEEMLRLVPNELREASYALGVTRARTTISVVLPAAMSGIITGVMLAIARAMGETAPLLLTALGNDLFMQTNPGQRMSTLSLLIFNNSTTGFEAAQQRAWAGCLTLVVFVLILTFAARLIARRGVVRS